MTITALEANAFSSDKNHLMHVGSRRSQTEPTAEVIIECKQNVLILCKKKAVLYDVPCNADANCRGASEII